jgi:hypothetical protein
MSAPHRSNMLGKRNNEQSSGANLISVSGVRASGSAAL